MSLEVSPVLAHDTDRTIAATKELSARAKRPNLFIKIPGTKEGLTAIEESIFAGVPVNVTTLLFSREQYLATAEAYLRGIERRVEKHDQQIPSPIRDWIIEFDNIDPLGTTFRYADDQAGTLKYAEFWVDFVQLKFAMSRVFQMLERVQSPESLSDVE